MQIKLMTWNIWHGKYLNDIITYIHDINPDIIGIQEVIEQEIDGEKLNSAERIAKAKGYHLVYYKSYHSDRHTPEYDQGNAILSKFPITSSQVHMLSTMADYQGSAETEPRIAIEADIAIADKNVHIVVTHLGYSAKFQPTAVRDQQVQKLLTLLQKEKTVLLGDFNSLPESETIQRVGKVLRLADEQLDKKTWSVYPTKYAEFSVEGLEYRIDYIFVSEDIKIMQTEIGDTKASDHLPVMTTVEI